MTRVRHTQTDALGARPDSHRGQAAAGCRCDSPRAASRRRRLRAAAGIATIALAVACVAAGVARSPDPAVLESLEILEVLDVVDTLDMLEAIAP